MPGSLFTQLHAALHLAHKYQCLDVKERVLITLKKYYTANFTEYNIYHDNTLQFALVRPPPQAAIAAVNIARLTRTLPMLPYALYLASNLEGRMTDGYRRRDGTIEYLSTEDLRLCIDARGVLAREMASLIRHVFTLTPTAGCKTTKKCAAARKALLGNAKMNAPGEIDVLKPYIGSIKAWADEHDLCKTCKKEMLEREVKERRRVWKTLPEVFELSAKECGFPSGDESE